MNETTAAYRQMIADGHQPTAQDVATLCDEIETLETMIEDERERVNVQREDIRALRIECDQLRAELASKTDLLKKVEARYDERWGDMPKWMYSEKELREYSWWEGDTRVKGVGLFSPGAAQNSVPFQAFRAIHDPHGLFRSAPVAVGAQGTPGYEWRSTLDRMPMDTWLICSNQDARLFWAKQAPRSGQWTFGGVGFRDPTHWLAPRLSISPQPSVPVAVEVPELTKQQIAMAEACCDEDDYPPFEEWAMDGKLGDLADIVATLYKAKSNAIDPSSILKDGEVAVPGKQWTVAQMLANAWSRHPLKCGERDALVEEWDALRSSKEGAA